MKNIIISFLLFATNYFNVSATNNEFDKITCQTNTYNLPKTSSNIYLNTECSDKGLTVYYSHTKDCKGENFCLIESFSTVKLPNSISSRLEQGYAAILEPIELYNGSEAYYLPSKCNSYCNEGILLWFDRNNLYMWGSKIANNKKAIQKIVNKANKFNELNK